MIRFKNLKRQDKELEKLIMAECKRQDTKLSLIPSENFFSAAVREAVGSPLMHKYSEGNVSKRYYEGNQIIDAIEIITQERAAKVFSIPSDWGVNVQALSGSNANLSVYLALLQPGDTMLSMYLPDGGHLSHGWSYEPKQAANPLDEVYLGGSRKVNITSQLYKVVQYKTDPKTHLFDYNNIEKIALKYKPQLLITGGTAYPRDIDYSRMKAIADSVGAYYLADIAHEAGLVAAGVLNSPVGIADVVTMTTHKTLRSGRGAIILGKQEIIEKVNKAVLPGLQGGPFNNNIAGICTGLGEALKPEFKQYANQVIKNAKVLADELINYNFDLLTAGTDKHLILIDMTNKGISGKYAARALDYAGLVLNMNTMPGETKSPANPSAIRLGTPLVTTRGMKEPEMRLIAGLIDLVINEIKPYTNLKFSAFEEKVASMKVIKQAAMRVKQLCRKYPLQF